ncbi:hypothetical protein FEAC_08930 [Ferrimicrobium acidiphilum DSM 19497]|uniref:Uncharacterized protein n=1 Tax=Ferrimicrobium acidiphilum DSM 19497 TaxID=1121877 RepID=A0A0D8FWU7_9ACTN|nr:hypothetical protein FEAC_08930 [Ferrimicrobium acidiphilum DSM 19497]
MVRPENWIIPAGESPAWVKAGKPGSRPWFVERRWAEQGVKSLFGRSKRVGRRSTWSESYSLPIFTMVEQSRSYHGEGGIRAHFGQLGHRVCSLKVVRFPKRSARQAAVLEQLWVRTETTSSPAGSSVSSDSALLPDLMAFVLAACPFVPAKAISPRANVHSEAEGYQC